MNAFAALTCNTCLCLVLLFTNAANELGASGIVRSKRFVGEVRDRAIKVTLCGIVDKGAIGSSNDEDGKNAVAWSRLSSLVNFFLVSRVLLFVRRQLSEEVPQFGDGGVGRYISAPQNMG